MIRFIDLGLQTENSKRDEFAFFDTITDKFLEFDNCQTWDNVDDFIFDYNRSRGDELQRFLNLIPNGFPTK